MNKKVHGALILFSWSISTQNKKFDKKIKKVDKLIFFIIIDMLIEKLYLCKYRKHG